MKCYDICIFFCAYYIINFFGYSVDMSSNPMEMYLTCVSQYLCEKWLLPNFPNDICRKNISGMKISILYQYLFSVCV